MSSHTSMFAGATIGAISNSIFNIHKHSERSALEKLSAAIAHSALYDAPTRTDETRCHPHTRINVLDRLERWAQGLCDEGAPIFWLHGGAGAGKSAIMQTLAERCASQQLALGSFFFSRTDETRNTVEVLIPTLVYQLVQNFPSALEILDPIINCDPMIFKKSLRAQLLDLLVPSLRHLVQLGSISDVLYSPRIFLIDGLDECNNPYQRQAIIRAVAELCHEHRIPVKFLIASRPEDEISTSFRCYRQENRLLCAISLSEDPKAEADIRRFLKDEFIRIRSQHSFHKMIPSHWPDYYDINRLVWKSSSHFIYASTAMKYIWSAKENPVRSLQVVLGLQAPRTISPFVELDALYHHILGSAAHLDKVLQILAHCICGGSPSIIVVCVMLDCSEDDLTVYLVDMSPLVVLFQTWRQGKEVKLLHSSLEDFLCNRSRSGTFHVDKQVYLASQLKRCIQVLNINSQLPLPSSDLRSSLLLPVLGQVLRTIHATSHLDVTQEALKQCSLLTYYEWRLHLGNGYFAMSAVIFDFFRFFLAVRSIKTSSGVLLFNGSADNFLDISHTHSSLAGRLIGPIFTLIFNGYSVRAISETFLRCVGTGLPGPGEGPGSEEGVCAIFDRADLPSIHQSVSNPSKRLAVAAEAILQFLFGDGNAPSDYSRLCVRESARPQADTTLAEFLDALVWALPKADISENIVLYLQRVPTVNEPQRQSIRMSLLRKCLEDYNTRMQATKLQQLDQKIETGDVNALIEKSCILSLNLQD